MEDINRFGPELALLIAAGLIVMSDQAVELLMNFRDLLAAALGQVR